MKEKVLKGTLIFANKLKNRNQNWFIEYSGVNPNDTAYNMLYEVAPGRIDWLSKNGVELTSGDEVEFVVQKTEEFPYMWAVPGIVKEKTNTEKPVEPKKLVERIEIKLEIFGPRDIIKKTIVCDSHDTSQSGYYSFLMRDSERNLHLFARYPIERTCFTSVTRKMFEVK